MSIIQKIKLLFKVKEPVEKLIEGAHEFKSGWKTLTFWITVTTQLSALVGALNGFIPPEASLVANTVLSGIYNLMRGFDKMDQNAVRPTLQSTEFWVGVMGMVSNSFVQLQTGGVNPEWMTSAQVIIGGAMAGAQNLGAQNRREEKPPVASPEIK